MIFARSFFIAAFIKPGGEFWTQPLVITDHNKSPAPPANNKAGQHVQRVVYAHVDPREADHPGKGPESPPIAAIMIGENQGDSGHIGGVRRWEGETFFAVEQEVDIIQGNTWSDAAKQGFEDLGTQLIAEGYGRDQQEDDDSPGLPAFEQQEDHGDSNRDKPIIQIGHKGHDQVEDRVLPAPVNPIKQEGVDLD